MNPIIEIKDCVMNHWVDNKSGDEIHSDEKFFYDPEQCNCTYCRGARILTMLQDLQVDIDSSGKPNSLSYSDSERENKRYATRTGRFIKKFFVGHFTDKDIEHIGSKINSALWISEDSIKILKGEDIRDFYLNGGVSSCMSYEDTQDYLDLYVDNPDVINLITVKTSLHAARALVWDINGVTYVDRIYHTSTHLEYAIVNYAKSHGWKNRDDLYKAPKVVVKIRNGGSSYWPYLDTMCYVTIDNDNTATLSPSGGNYMAQCTDGTLEGYEDFICDSCSGTFNTDEITRVDGQYYCNCCYDDIFTRCGQCGNDIRNEDSIYVESTGECVCETCLDRDYQICDHCREYFLALNPVSDGEVCEDCLEEYYSTCDECGSAVSKDELTEIGDCYYCDECIEDFTEEE